MKLINNEDVKALGRIESVFDKLDKILDKVSNYNAFKDEQLISDKERRFVTEHRNYYRDFIEFENFSVNYGFGWFLKSEVFVYLDFCINKKNQSDKEAEKIAKLVKDGISGIDFLYKNEDAISIGFKKGLKAFLKDENQEEVIIKLLNEWITKTKQFKNNNSELFKI